MKKIPWIKRIFMSWDKLVNYFNQDQKNENDTLSELKATYNQLFENLQANLTNKDKEIGKLLEENKQINDKLKITERDFENKNTQFIQGEKAIIELRHKLEQLRQNNEIRVKEEKVKQEINEKLKTISKIENTFFAKTGNKGKGELGEKQVKIILEKSGLGQDFWTENLIVGNNNVEFAIKSGEESKWIPIDSKVIEPELDEDKKAIIDDSYRKKVSRQAKEITKYLNKKNTASYGILVLQSDSIYMSLYKQFPSFFQQTISESKIYIASPSSFVQFAWSVSQILDIYEKVHNDEKIYDDMLSALDSVTKFASKLFQVHKDFKIAMETHYPTIERKGNVLKKRLLKANKVTEPKLIDKI